MRKTIVLALMLASGIASADRNENKIIESDYNFQSIPGTIGGIVRSEYKTWEMTDKERQQALTAYNPIVTIAYGGTSQTKAKHPAKLTGTHQVCYSNPWPLAATASYVFTIDDSHHTAKLTQKLSIAGNHTMCVQHQTYLIVTPLAPGRYAYKVFTYGQMSAPMGTFQGNASGNGFLVVS